MSSPMPPTNAPMPPPAPAEQPMGGAMIMCPSCGAEMSLSAQPMEAPAPPMQETPEMQAQEDAMGTEAAPAEDAEMATAGKYMGGANPAKPNQGKAAQLLRAFGKK